MSFESITQEKAPNASGSYEHAEQEIHIERVTTLEMDNFRGLSVKCVLVYLVNRLLLASCNC